MTKPSEKSKVVRKLRCAVYTRKSSEEGLEQEFNSLHAQREACEAFIASQRSEGWVLVRDQYDDGGISGGTLDRPGLQLLLEDAVFRQPEIVAGTWKAARAHANNVTEADARAALQELDPLWDELFPAEQARIVALLVERVDIGVDGLNVRLRVDGLGSLAREMLAGDMGAAA